MVVRKSIEMIPLVLLVLLTLQGKKTGQSCSQAGSQGLCIPHQVKDIYKKAALNSTEVKQAYTYTHFQCMDQCQRQSKCNGITFVMNFTSSTFEKQTCMLFYKNITLLPRNITQCDHQLCYFSATKYDFDFEQA